MYKCLLYDDDDDDSSSSTVWADVFVPLCFSLGGSTLQVGLDYSIVNVDTTSAVRLWFDL